MQHKNGFTPYLEVHVCSRCRMKMEWGLFFGCLLLYTSTLRAPYNHSNCRKLTLFLSISVLLRSSKLREDLCRHNQEAVAEASKQRQSYGSQRSKSSTGYTMYDYQYIHFAVLVKAFQFFSLWVFSNSITSRGTYLSIQQFLLNHCMQKSLFLITMRFNDPRSLQGIIIHVCPVFIIVFKTGQICNVRPTLVLVRHDLTQINYSWKPHQHVLVP